MHYLHLLNYCCNMDFSVNLSWVLYVHVLVIFFLLVVFPINFVRQKQTTTSYLLRKKINNISKTEIRNIHILSNFKEYTITISISFVLFIGFNILGFLNINKYPDLLDKISILECGHAFHKECLKEWMVKSNNCPLCREDINKLKDDEASKLGQGVLNIQDTLNPFFLSNLYFNAASFKIEMLNRGGSGGHFIGGFSGGMGGLGGASGRW